MKRWVKQVGSIMIAGALLTGSTAVVGLSGATEVHAAEAKTAKPSNRTR